MSQFKRKARFEKFTHKDQNEWFRVFLTLPEQGWHDHYWTAIPVFIINEVSELLTLLNFEIKIEEDHEENFDLSKLFENFNGE